MALSILLVRVSAAGGPAHPLRVRGPCCVIGRSHSAEIRLVSPEVSGAHARLLERRDGLWVEDLGSSNGTTVGGVRLSPGVPAPLPEGASLQIGPYRVEVSLARSGPSLGEVSESEGTATLAARLLEDLVAAGACPPATVQVTLPGGEQRRCVLTPGRTLRIGRDPSCDLGAEDPDLSRLHAELRMEPAGAVAVDLGSKNGTFIGEVRLGGPRALRSGDRLRLGGIRLVYEDPAETYLRELEGERVGGSEAGSNGAAAEPRAERPKTEPVHTVPEPQASEAPRRSPRGTSPFIALLLAFALVVVGVALWALVRLFL